MQKEIIEHEDQLPATVDELQKFILIGEGAISSYKVKLKTLEKADIAKKVRDRTLKDGQKCGEAVLLATAKLGELLTRVPQQEHGKDGKFENKLPKDINRKFSHYAQEIHKHREIMHNVIAKAIDRDDIPTKHDVLKKIKENKREAKIKAQKQEIEHGLEQPSGLYDIIVIDPPWEYNRKYDADGGRVASPYPEMSYDNLLKLKLPAKNNCILWLWTTNQFMFDAFNLLDYWQFDFKCILVWDKQKMGIGQWLRLQCEYCLLGVKGKPLWENKDIRDIIRESRTNHSVKPIGFYNMIDENFVGRKLDYFGRKKRKGWSIYGTEQNSISK